MLRVAPARTPADREPLDAAAMNAADAMAFEWDCDCGWEFDLESGVPPPPPLFDLPPPPVPPTLQPPPELCAAASAHPLGLETCQAFLVRSLIALSCSIFVPGGFHFPLCTALKLNASHLGAAHRFHVSRACGRPGA